MVQLHLGQLALAGAGGGARAPPPSALRPQQAPQPAKQAQQAQQTPAQYVLSEEPTRHLVVGGLGEQRDGALRAVALARCHGRVQVRGRPGARDDSAGRRALPPLPPLLHGEQACDALACLLAAMVLTCGCGPIPNTLLPGTGLHVQPQAARAGPAL